MTREEFVKSLEKIREDITEDKYNYDGAEKYYQLQEVLYNYEDETFLDLCNEWLPVVDDDMIGYMITKLDCQELYYFTNDFKFAQPVYKFDEIYQCLENITYKDIDMVIDDLLREEA